MLSLRNVACFTGSRPRLLPLTLIVLTVLAGFTAADPKAAPPLSAQQQRRLQERDRYAKEAADLRKQERWVEASAAARQMLAIEREVFGDCHEDVAASLEQLAKMDEARDDFAAARKARQEVLRIRTKLSGPDSWKVTDARLALAYTDQRATLDQKQQKAVAEAERKFQKVLELHRQGKFQEAVPLARAALETDREILGAQHPKYADKTYILALMYHHLGARAKAEALYLETWEIAKKTHGERHPFSAQCMNNLGDLYRVKGDYAQAETFLQEALRIRREVLGADHADVAESLNNLAVVFWDKGVLDKAEALEQEALAIIKKTKGDKDPSYANSLNGLATLYKRLGDYAKAEPLYQEALKIRREKLGKDHPSYASTLNGLALLYEETGAYTKAKPFFQEALAIRRKRLGESHPDYAISLLNLAGLYKAMGAYDKAEELNRQGVEVFRKALGEKHPHYAIALNNLANLYLATGDYAKAEPLLQQALAVLKETLGETHSSYLVSSNNLAALYDNTGAFAKAEPLYQNILKIRRETLGENHPDYAISLNNLAVLYSCTGKHTEAERLQRQALTIAEKMLGEKHPLTLTFLASLGSSYLAAGATSEAFPHFARALTAFQNEAEETFAVLGERERLQFLQSQRLVLDRYLTTALARDSHPASELYDHVLRWKGVVAARQAEDTAARDAPELRPLIDELSAARARLAHLAFVVPSPKQRQVWLDGIAALSKRREDLEARLANASATYRYERQLARLRSVDIRHALPQGTALVDFFEYGHLRPPEAQGREILSTKRLLAFVLKGDHDLVRISLGPAAPITKAVQAWRDALQNGQTTAQNAAAAEVARLVWEPLRPHLAGVQVVLAAPDGALCQIPLAALPGRQPGSYLLEELTIGYVTSGRHAAALLAAEPSTKADGLLAVGGIAYDADIHQAAAVALNRAAPVNAQTRAGFLDLPETKREAEAVVRFYQQSFPHQRTPLLLTGRAATEGRIKRELSPALGVQPWRFVHFAGHGFFAPPTQLSALHTENLGDKLPAALADRERQVFGQNPLLLSGLVLAGGGRVQELTTAAPPTEDGILTAEEVYGLDLRGTELVVLSACDTGRGDVAGGEGVFGLQRAFHVAGTPTVVASLWKVDDHATQTLMAEFYRNLWEKKHGKLQALREAQLTMLRYYDPRQRHLRGPGRETPTDPAKAAHQAAGERVRPFFWAAFILSGDWR